MKKLQAIVVILLCFSSTINFAQQIPDFGAASGFAVFSSAGAFANVGPTTVTGDVGNNSGAFAAFPPGTLIGQIHSLDGVSGQAATSLAAANTTLSGNSCGTTIPTALGSGQILTPGIYCQAAVSTLTGDLTLDAQGDPNAIFIIKFSASFTTAASSNVILTNSASLCNVYWHVVGAVVLGANSSFGGTIVSNGAITMGDGATLAGRALTTAGAISLTNNTITIAATPEAATISASGSTTICSGNSIMLSGNIDGVWSNSDTTSAINVNSSGDNFVTNTNAYCSVISNHINVTVNPLPSATTGDSASVCIGDNITLGASSVAGHTYSWSSTTGLSSSTISNPVVNTSVTTTTYTLTETITATGCMNTNSVTITTNPLPEAFAGINSTICKGESVTLGDIAIAGNTYAWTPTTGLSSATISNPVINPDSTTTYSLTETITATGCVNTNPVTITVNPLPLAGMGNNTSVCIGNSATLGTPAVAGNTYSWTPSAALSSATIAQPSASPSTQTTYTLTETNSLTGCSKTDSIIISINPLPLAVTIIETDICSGDGVAIGANSVSGNTYVWTPTTNLNSPTISNPIASPTTTIFYTLTETIVATGCENSNSTTIRVNTAPSIITQPVDKVVSIDSTVIFSVEVIGTNLTYQWRKGLTNLINGSNISGVNTDTITINNVSVADTGDYNVVISGLCFISSTSQNASLDIIDITAPTNIASHIEEAASIYPNPFSSLINIRVNASPNNTAELKIYNVLGVEVMNVVLSEKVTTLQTNNFPAGIYTYKIIRNNRTAWSGRLISQH